MSKRQPLIWNALTIFRKTVCALPHERAVALGGSLGRLVERFTKKKSAEAQARCARILGLSDERAKEIVRGVYDHFGRAATEFARMPLMAPVMTELVKTDGYEYLEAAFKEGRGVLLATAHIGNWEYAACMLAQRGLPINALGADQRDDRITELIRELREAGGVHALGKANDLKAMIKALQAGEIIAVPIDQDARRSGVLSPFLGSPASTPVGPAKLASKIGCAVIPCYSFRNADGITFTTKFLPPMRGRSGEPFGENVQTSMDDLNAVLTKGILEHPAQWMWMYPRWESVERGCFDECGD